MNDVKDVEGLSKQKEKLEKARTNVIKILETRFKQVPNRVLQSIYAIENKSALEMLFTNSIIVADARRFSKSFVRCYIWQVIYTLIQFDQKKSDTTERIYLVKAI